MPRRTFLLAADSPLEAPGRALLFGVAAWLGVAAGAVWGQLAELPPLQQDPPAARAQASCPACEAAAAEHNGLAAGLDDLSRKIAQRRRGIAILDRVIAGLRREIAALRGRPATPESPARIVALERLLVTRLADRVKDEEVLERLRAQRAELATRLPALAARLRRCEEGCPRRPPGAPQTPSPGEPAADPCAGEPARMERARALAAELERVRAAIEDGPFDTDFDPWTGVDDPYPQEEYQPPSREPREPTPEERRRDELIVEARPLVEAWLRCHPQPERVRVVCGACGGLAAELDFLVFERWRRAFVATFGELAYGGGWLPSRPGDMKVPEALAAPREEPNEEQIAARRSALAECERTACAPGSVPVPPPAEPAAPQPGPADAAVGCSDLVARYLRGESIERRIAELGAELERLDRLAESYPIGSDSAAATRAEQGRLAAVRRELRDDLEAIDRGIGECFDREPVRTDCVPCQELADELDEVVDELRWADLRIEADKVEPFLDEVQRAALRERAALLEAEASWLSGQLDKCEERECGDLVRLTLIGYQLLSVTGALVEGGYMSPDQVGRLFGLQSTPVVQPRPPSGPRPTEPTPAPGDEGTPPPPPPPPPPTPPSEPPSQPPPPPPPPTGCAALSGSFRGNGGCGIGRTTVTASAGEGQLTLAPFGSESSATFAAGTDAATASGLVVFGKPNHTCVLACTAEGRFTLTCTNVTTGAQCTETFRK